MRIRRRLLPLLFEKPLEKGDVVSSDPTTAAAEAVVVQSSDTNSKERAYPKGTKDAPVDGNDGLPHDGPFVETGADRDRKKAKEAGEKEPSPIPVDGEKYNLGSDLPDSHDGVMNDKNRESAKEGTRGTEGGVSIKSSSTLDTKKPETPKEQPSLPHSEQQRMGDGDNEEATEEEKKKLLDKPADLPEKPHDIPMPENPSSSKDKDSRIDTTDPPGQQMAQEHEEDIIQPLHSLVLSFTMIIFSEIGDKTFLVAALMAMRHPRMVVFTAAFSALITMTVLSAVLGHAVPTLIPKALTNFLAAGLFLIFGVKMLIEARGMSADEGVGEEMKEVEMELEEKEHQQRRKSRRRSSIDPYVLESGRGVRKSRHTNSHSRLPSPPDSPVSDEESRDSSPSRRSTWQNFSTGVTNLFSLLLSPAWVQTFVMTFLGEWGDRSQIATIAMAAGQDYWWVTGGALVGHAMCTAAAVIGGRAIAGKVSSKVGTYNAIAL
ncbi:MAG: hypothetical protein Q9227_001651 [Pyrenula ochraceoflavens]